MNKRVLTASLLIVFGATCAMPALAQKFPHKPITLVIPFAPGGNLDVVARTLAPALGKILGQPVIIDNRAGAGGAIGASYVARTRPDGYTLLVSTPNAIAVLPLMTKTAYALDSFSPVGLVATTPLLVVVREKGVHTNIEGLLSTIRNKPNEISAGHAGPGTTNHVALMRLEEAGNISLNTVPYKGSAPALTDLLGGQIDLVVDQLTSSASHIQSGSVRAVAVMSRERDPTLPNVPTLREAGIKGFEATTATGLLAPGGTPQDIVNTLNTALRKALAEDAVKDRLSSIGSPGQASSPAEWSAMLRTEEASAKLLAQAGKLRAD